MILKLRLTYQDFHQIWVNSTFLGVDLPCQNARNVKTMIFMGVRRLGWVGWITSYGRNGASLRATKICSKYSSRNTQLVQFVLFIYFFILITDNCSLMLLTACFNSRKLKPLTSHIFVKIPKTNRELPVWSCLAQPCAGSPFRLMQKMFNLTIQPCTGFPFTPFNFTIQPSKKSKYFKYLIYNLTLLSLMQAHRSSTYMTMKILGNIFDWLDVLGLYCDLFGVNHCQVGLAEQIDQTIFTGVLECT